MSLREASPRRRFEERVVLGLGLVDALACALAIVAAYEVRLHVPTTLLAPLRQDLSLYVRVLPAVVVLWWVIFGSMGLYRLRRFISPPAEMTAVFRAVTLTTLMVAAVSFLSRADYSRAMLGLFWCNALVLSLVARGLARKAIHRWAMRDEFLVRAVIVGCGDLARLVAQRIGGGGLPGYELVGFVAASGCAGETAGPPLLGNIEELPELIVRHRVDEVLVARPDIEPALLMAVVDRCEGLPVEFHLVGGPLQMLIEHMEVSSAAGLPVLELPPRRFRPWQSAVKRILDVLLATVMLIVFAPAMLVIAFLIRRQTGASALFRQTRVGYRGKPFTMLKFRTMVETADPYQEAPRGPDDPRVTPIGRYLRRTSLDELPQLINVLRGEMSLVGPRPEMPFIVEQYEPWQRRRLDVKPGITGLWQILGRKDLPLRENIEYDFYYIRNWSVWLDLSILLRTVPAVLFGRGAY